jgi:hypothetical protein
VIACGWLLRAADLRQSTNQPGGKFMQFALMIFRQDSQHPVALCCHSQLDAPAIIQILIALDQSRLLAALAQFDNGVMPQPQPLCGVGHSCLHFIRGPCELQQQLVLLRVETRIHSTPFAELEELP